MEKKEKQYLSSYKASWIFSFFSFFFLFLFLIPYSLGNSSSSDLDYGVLRSVQGTVKFFFIEGNKGKSIRAHSGMKVYPQDKLISYENSKAHIDMHDGNTIYLAPKSEILIENSLKRGKSHPIFLKTYYSIRLFFGKIRSLITNSETSDREEGPSSWKYQVSTDSAVIGVRGTDFVVSHNEGYRGDSLVTTVSSLEGEVQVLPIEDFRRGDISSMVSVTSRREVIFGPTKIRFHPRKLKNEEIMVMKRDMTFAESSKRGSPLFSLSLLLEDDLNLIPEERTYRGQQGNFAPLLNEVSHSESSNNPFQSQTQIHTQTQGVFLEPHSILNCETDPICRGRLSPESIPRERTNLHIRIVHEN